MEKSSHAINNISDLPLKNLVTISNYLEIPIISIYFSLVEMFCYFNSLKTAKNKRDFYEHLVLTITTFLELLKTKENLEFLNERIFLITEKLIFHDSTNIIKQAKLLDEEGFKLLNIKNKMDFASLKKLYIKAVKLNHPDVGGETNKMQVINKAYSQFHKLISLYSGSTENNTKTLKEFIVNTYTTLINILLDSWSIDEAYKYFNDALSYKDTNSILCVTEMDFNCYLLISISARLPSIKLETEALKILNYAEEMIKDNEENKYHTKLINNVKESIRKRTKYRVVISHIIQAENAKRLGIIEEKKYQDFLTKNEGIKKESLEEISRLNKILEDKIFIQPLPYEYDLNITNPQRKGLIPEPSYYQTDIKSLSKTQQWEYFKAFSKDYNLGLIRKYFFVRLHSYLISAFINFDKQFYIKIIRELEILFQLFKDNSSCSNYSKKVLDAISILGLIDENDFYIRRDLLYKYIDNKGYGQIILSYDLLRFLFLSNELMEKELTI